ncbi:MAG TPA: sugar transferase [Acidimicrobiales bacterium]|nr:sugar transferase [Acidimicrobiales bacterium]
MRTTPSTLGSALDGTPGQVQPQLKIPRPGTAASPSPSAPPASASPASANPASANPASASPASASPGHTASPGAVALHLTGPDGPNHPSASNTSAGNTSVGNTSVGNTVSMAPPRSAALRRRLLASDLAALLIAWGPEALFAAPARPGARLLCVLVAIFSQMGAMGRSGLYRSRVCSMRTLEALRVVATAVVGAAAFDISEWLTGGHDVVRALSSGAGACALVLVGRWRFGRWLKLERADGRFLRTVVIVGDNEDAAAVWDLLSSEPELGYKVGGVIGDDPESVWRSALSVAKLSEEPAPGTVPAPVPVAHSLDDLGELAAAVGASGVIVVNSAVGGETSVAAVNRALALGLHAQVWPGLAGLAARRMKVVPVLGAPTIYVEPQDRAGWEVAAKRAMDIVVTLALAPVALVLLGLCAVLIKAEDRGPVIHRHKVVGRHGVPLTVYKLRTMVPNASTMLNQVAALNERRGGPLFKASYDPRVTRVGRLLRASSIDELPQLWNVLMGTMSLVGPRFALPAEVAHFDPELRRRHQMRPGMTGLWQSEARDNPSFSAYRRLDLFYVDNWSLLLDVAILMNTAYQIWAKVVRGALSRRRNRATTYGAPAAATGQ